MDGLDNISAAIVESKKGNTLFSAHSIKQFMVRWYIRHHEQITAEEAVIKMTSLFEGSKEEHLHRLVRVKRLIRNQGREARYFYINGWRFVIEKSDITNCIGVTLVLTVELDKYGFQRKLPNRPKKSMPKRFRKKPNKKRNARGRYSKQRRLEL